MRSCVLLVCLLACAGGSKRQETARGAASGEATPPAGGTAESEGEPGATCEPGRCLGDISAVVIARRAQARACFDAGAKQKPGLEGKVIINFEIDPEGTVVDASQGMQDGQLEDAGIVSCIADVIKQLRFAKSAKGKTTRAYHRFDFAP